MAAGTGARTLRLGTQLALILALALALGAAQLALFLWASAAAMGAHHEALAWSHHAILVKEVEASTALYLRDLEDRVLRGAAVDLDRSRARLGAATAASRQAAATFSEEEQAEERQVGEALARLLAQGDAVAAGAGVPAVEALRRQFDEQVQPRLARRIEEEEEGARAAAARGAALSRRGLLLSAAAGLLLFAGAAGLAIRVARRLRAGLAGLEESARAIAGGQLGTTVPAEGDELGVVGAAFNAMSARLQETTVSRAELSRLVQERTQALELSSAELERSLRELRETRTQLATAARLAAVGSLAAGVAHEMNNPLSFVVANTGFARDSLKEMGEQLAAGRQPARELVTETLEALEEARLGAHRVREIVRDLRTFARVEEERREPVEVGAVLETALRMASADLARVGRVVRELPELPPAQASAGRLAQVFHTLLVNAARAMPERSPAENEIRLGGEATDTEVVVTVADNGVGLSAADRERIFEPFAAARPPGPGAGMGLAICQRLVQHLGGTIGAEGAPGRGTCFRVALPRARPRDEAVPRLVSPTLAGPHGRLLLVDDEPLVLTTLQRMLVGHEIETAADGRAALALLRQGRSYDAILIDLVMAGMSGMELYAELERSHPPLVPRVLIVTGASFSPGVREFLERVPNPRLEKPFDPEVLRRLVQQLVAQHRGLLTPGAAPAVGPTLLE